MSESDDLPGGDRPLEPEAVASRSFATAFRGFDPVQVRAFLGTVADELGRLQEQESELRRRLEHAPTSASEGPDEPVARQDDEAATDRLVTAEAQAAILVEDARAEADRLVREARDRVATLGSAATSETTRVLDEARVEAARLRATAVDDLKGRFEDAEATAVRKIAEAEREAAAIRVKAREESEATIEAARERGREMVAEAQAARERMLADLAKRKRAAQAQLEQLRSGRDRLLDTLKVARRSIDEMTTRFDAGDGSSVTPPSSGTPSGSVTTTPGAASSDARPRAASTTTSGTATAAPPPRPVRTRAVSLGEVPSAARPQIAAPQAAAATPPPAAPSAPADVEDVGQEATEPVGSTVEPDPVPVRTEERRSSALRILRRNKPGDPPPALPVPAVGRDSHAEGVRIIGRPSAPATEPEAEIPEADEVRAELPAEPAELAEPAESVEPVVAQEPEPEPDPEPAPEPAPQPSPEPVPASAETPEPEPEPPVEEEIRPRIEDLFARMRAEREATTASARAVLAAAPAATPTSVATMEALEPEPEPEPDSGPVAAPVASDADEHRLQTRDAAIEPLVAQLTKRLKRALQDEQNASLDRLRTSRGKPTVEQILSRADDQSLPYRHLALPFLEEGGRAGASASPFGPTPIATDDLAAQLADDLAGALRVRLDGVLSIAASDDLELGALSERISAAYREWKVSKVERLAMHYLVAAHERGGFLAHPEGTALRWIVDDDGPCPDCEDNALAGANPRGQAFPTGQLHPPAHLGCRCALVATPA